MRFVTRRVAVFVVSLFSAAAFWSGIHAQAPGPHYLLTDIGVLPGQTSSTATALNSNGIVVGASHFRAVMHRDGALHDLGTLGTSHLSHSQANGINDAGVIVGESSRDGGVLRAFIHSGGTMSDLAIPFEYSGRARAINSRGQIVGEAGPSNGSRRPHAFVYENGTFTDLGTLNDTDRAYSQANAINSRGQIVGFSTVIDGSGTPDPGHAVMWEDGRMVDLGMFNGFGTAAWAINDTGSIAGAYGPVVNGTRTTRAFVHDLSNSTFTELPVPEGSNSFALGINAAGDVVGYVILRGEEFSRGVLWRGGVMYDLNDLISPASGWALRQGRAINDAGQIAGSGRSPSGEIHGVLLTPSAWNSRDIGAQGIAGSAGIGSDGIFAVRGDGHDIWDTNDSFHFMYHPLTGDGSIVARLDSMSSTYPYAKAGVMLRETLDSASAHVILNVKPDGGIEFMQRAGAGEQTTFLAGGVAPSPAWLRLARSGSTITGSVSADGVSWTDVGSTTTSMGAALQAGLAVTSHDPYELNTARFAGVSVMPAPWANVDVGSVGVTGNASLNGGSLSASGAGSDIWGTTDSFHYVYQPLPADGEITAHVVRIQNTHPKAKVGVMIRDGVAPDAAHVILNVKPDGDVEFMQRASAGGATDYLAGGTARWLRLERSGSTITASISADGSTWTVVGSTTASFSNPVTVGVAVTSHDAAQLNSGAVDNVSVVR